MFEFGLITFITLHIWWQRHTYLSIHTQPKFVCFKLQSINCAIEINWMGIAEKGLLLMWSSCDVGGQPTICSGFMLIFYQQTMVSQLASGIRCMLLATHAHPMWIASILWKHFDTCCHYMISMFEFHTFITICLRSKCTFIRLIATAIRNYNNYNCRFSPWFTFVEIMSDFSVFFLTSIRSLLFC